MVEQNPTEPGSNLSNGPELKDDEMGVHIIYVPVSIILAEMHLTALDQGTANTVTLAQVAKHVGAALPTDIVVFACEPWHFAGHPGHPRRLQAHPDAHHTFPETVLELSIKGREKAVWWSETPFSITGVTPSGPGHANFHYPEAGSPATREPFTWSPVAERIMVGGREIHVVRSSVPFPAAEQHMYKIEFTIGGDAIDPDVYCAP
jgi:hypothetical protein